MRVFLLAVLLVVGGTQANFLTDIGDAFKTTFGQLVDSGKEVGGQLLDQLKVTGAQLASQGLQALMLNVADAISSTDAPATDGKRQLAAAGNEDPTGAIFQHADELKHYMQVAMNASNHMDHPEQYQPTIQDFMDLIDRVVAGHETTDSSSSSFRKRQVEAVLSPLSGLSGLLTVEANKLKMSLTTAMAALTGLAERLAQPDTDLQEIIANADKVVADHSASVDNVLNSLLAEVTSLMPKAGNKRSLESAVTALGQGLTAVFQPNADVTKSIVSTLGGLLKDVVSSLEASEAQLMTRGQLDMKAQIAAVTQAGQAAVTALRDALPSVMEQTLAELYPHMTAIVADVISAMTRQ